MRLFTLRQGKETVAARLQGDDLVELAFSDVGALLAAPDWEAQAASSEGRRHALSGADLAPVVPRPNKIICVGLNYRSHIEEMHRDVPPHPTLFAKYFNALTGPNDPIPLPPESRAPDWEAELAVVVGRGVRRISEHDAGNAIAGFTVINDLTMRDWQRRTIEFLQGKTWDGSTPFGPALVTPDEVAGGPDADLTLWCEVDGEIVQKARTADLVFSPRALVSYCSTIMTLNPGDVIATGTPGGVGAGRNPPVFLRPGQVLRTVVEGVGELLNTCVAEET